jgi:translation elongation factor EF-1alpha
MIIKPPNIPVTVKEIYVDDVKKDVALVGELIEIVVNIKDDDIDSIRQGNV